MKLAAYTPVYNEEKLITGAIKSFAPFVEKHIVMVAGKPFYGTPQPLDRTMDVASDLGAEVIITQARPEHRMRNEAMELLDQGEYDWILVNDADMWFEHDTLKELIAILQHTKEDIVCMPQWGYWKDTDHILVGDDFCPVVALRPNKRFTHIGNANGAYKIIEHLKVHHLAWCAPKDILKKVTTYSHAPEFDGAAWYTQYYEPWKEGQKAVLPTKRFDVAYKPLPDELKKYLPEGI
jgi:hypothetical protein